MHCRYHCLKTSLPTCTLVVSTLVGLARVRATLPLSATLAAPAGLAEGGVLLESVIITVLLVEGVKGLVAVVAVAVRLPQVSLLTLGVATVRLVEATFVGFS